VRISWGGSNTEVRLLESYPDRQFVVCVPNLHDMSRAAFSLGALVQIEGAIAIKGRDALMMKKSYDWKKLSGEMGFLISRSLVVKLAADAVRQGMHPKLATVAADLLQERGSPFDADVLMRTGR
jgi:hypothetical protein